MLVRKNILSQCQNLVQVFFISTKDFQGLGLKINNLSIFVYNLAQIYPVNFRDKVHLKVDSQGIL